MVDEGACTVCGEVAPAGSVSVCHSCGERFHLNERNDTEGKDCGAVWIDEQYQALRFACQRCLNPEQQNEKLQAPARQPRVRPRRYRRRDV